MAFCYGQNTLSFERLESVRVYFKKFILLFSKDGLNWSKVTVKTFITVTKYFNLINKQCSFELSIQQRNLKKMYIKET